MNDEPSASPDLAAIDLSLSFAPAWAKEADTSKQIARLTAKHGGEDRGDRPGKRRDVWEDRGPRQDRRPSRSGGGNHPDRGGGRPSRNEDRHETRRPQRESRPEPTLSGWDIQFLPDRHGVEGLVRQIKASAKAYPLFDLARLVLEKSERYLVEFKRKSEDATPLFQLKADGSLWLSEAEALAYALAQQMDKFYRRERVTVEPPKGVYPFVAVCGMSGTLLGPPNYHDYQTKIRQLHAERYASMPFEAYKSRIRMDRDEASIEKWKQEQSVRDVFYPLELDEKPKAAVEQPAQPETSEPVAENAELAQDAREASPSEEEIAGNPSEAAEPSGEAVEGTEETVAENVEVTGETPAILRPGALTLEEAERHFREHHAGSAIVKIRDRVLAPGPAALNESAPAVLQVTRREWEQLDRFPLPLAHSLGQQLTSRGLQIFKTHDNITYVGVARPRYLDRVATPVSEALSAMIDYIESHPSTPRPEQWQALVALRPVPTEGAEAERESAVARDLSWLLHEGHIIDYAKRGLEAARRPKPPTPKAAKKRTEPETKPETVLAGEPELAAEPVAAPIEGSAAEPVTPVDSTVSADKDAVSET